jgi:hypothetical protein
MVRVPGCKSCGPGFKSWHLHGRNWWRSSVTLLLGDKEMEWLGKLASITLLGLGIGCHDFKPGLCEGLWYRHARL